MKERPEISSEQRPDLLALVGRLPKPLRRLAYLGIVTGTAGLFVAAACGDKDNQPNATSEPNEPKAQDFDQSLAPILPVDDLERSYITGGPHFDGYSKIVRFALDFALGREIIKCPGGKPQKDRFAVASDEGEVVVVGSDDRRSANHSMVVIRHADGTSSLYVHLSNIKVKVGDKVAAGQALANPSCEFPKGGGTSGEHLHWALLDEFGRPVAINGKVLSGWQVVELAGNYQGKLVKTGRQDRTADTRRCGPDEESQDRCGGIRNDLGEKPAPTSFDISADCQPKEGFASLTGVFELKSLDGRTVNMADYACKPLVLLYLAGECDSFCVNYLEDLLTLFRRYQPQGLQVIGVITEQNPFNEEAMDVIKQQVPLVLVDERIIGENGEVSYKTGWLWEYSTSLSTFTFTKDGRMNSYARVRSTMDQWERTLETLVAQ